MTQTINFRAVFEAAPNPYLLLDMDLRIVAVNDCYLRVTMTERDDIVGRDLFEVFPDPPDQPEADGVRNLNESLNRVKSSRGQDVMNVQKYDIRQPDGRFVERWWQPINVPVFDEQGTLYWIIHYVEDVTVLLHAREASSQAERQLGLVRNLVMALAGTLILAIGFIALVAAGLI